MKKLFKIDRIVRNYYFFLTILFMIFNSLAIYGQSQNNYWAFGDSVGIDFNYSIPLIDTSIIIYTGEAAASIADKNGNLLFYVGSAEAYLNTNGAYKYVVRNYNDLIIQNGDSLAGNTSITQGLLIIPNPTDSINFYIFHINYPGDNLYYSTVDMSANSNQGNVTVLNQFITDSINEKMQAVRAANGKDWWVVTHKSYTNTFVLFKIDSTGIHGPNLQSLGITFNGNAASGQMIFSKSGDKIIYSGGTGYTCLYNFNRCTGQISNEVILDTFYFGSNCMPRYGASFSELGNYVYLSSFDSLWQFDLSAPNIPMSKQLLFSIPHIGSPNLIMGQHMIGPNGKIYIANANNFISINDTLSNYLSVIDTPENQGVSCNFLPYSFWLGGRKSTASLPNLPNYNLGILENVNCDSILAFIETPPVSSASIIAYPNPTSGLVSFKMRQDSHIKKLEIFNQIGTSIIISTEKVIDLSDYASGLYFFRITGQKEESYYGKIFKE